MVALIGSSMVKPGSTSEKPCQLSLGEDPSRARSPRPCRAGVSGPQTENHQVPGVSSPILIMARRNSSASVRDSSTRAVPPGRSIMAAATSQEAMIAYCGLVEVCMRKASLKTLLVQGRAIGVLHQDL